MPALKLMVNGDPVEVEAKFNTPKEYDDKYNPGKKQWGFTLLVRQDVPSLGIRAGEEYTFYTKNERLRDNMQAFGRGTPFVLSYVQGPGMKYGMYQVSSAGSASYGHAPVGRAPEPEYPFEQEPVEGFDAPAGKAAGPAPIRERDRAKMLEAYVDAMHVREQLVEGVRQIAFEQTMAELMADGDTEEEVYPEAERRAEIAADGLAGKLGEYFLTKTALTFWMQRK